MPLSRNEIKARAMAFSYEWEGAKAERAAFLLELYQKYTSLFPIPETVKAKRKKNIT